MELSFSMKSLFETIIKTVIEHTIEQCKLICDIILSRRHWHTQSPCILPDVGYVRESSIVILYYVYIVRTYSDEIYFGYFSKTMQLVVQARESIEMKRFRRKFNRFESMTEIEFTKKNYSKTINHIKFKVCVQCVYVCVCASLQKQKSNHFYFCPCLTTV